MQRIKDFLDNTRLQSLVLRLMVCCLCLAIAQSAVAQLPGYHFRKPVAIDHTIVSGSSDLIDFPVLIHISSDTDLRTTTNGGDVASANGYDIAFTAADGSTRLDHDLEYYDATTGEYVAWVRIPTLEWDVDTDIYLYYGDFTKTTDPSSSGTWNSGYQGAWHLNEKAAGTGNVDLYEDATANSFDGDDEVSASLTDGVVSSGQEFDGLDDYISMGNVLSYGKNDPVTYSAWIKTTDSDVQIIGKSDHATDLGVWFYLEDGPGVEGNLSLWLCDAAGNCMYRWSDESFNDNTWHYVVATYDGSDDASGIQLYGDGEPLTIWDQGNNTVGTVTNSFPLVIGAANGLIDFLDGFVDEPRVSDVVRSEDWIRTEYANQSNPTSSITMGTPAEIVIAPGGITTDLELWLKADEGPNTSTNGGAITSWSDLSINKFHATGTGDAIYQTSFSNYHGSVDFPGGVEAFSDRAMTRTNGTSQTIFVVGKIPAVANKTFVEFGDGTNRAYFKDERYKKAGGIGDYSFQANQPSIWTASDPGSTTPGAVAENGQFLATSGDRNANWTSGKYLLGYDDTGGDELDGEIAEVIFYDRQLSATEQQKVESYLAIRYGITLTTDNDGNTTALESPNGDGINEGDYIASDGTLLWDASANSTYHNDVTAIGRDDYTHIDQTKSISANSDAMVVMDKGGDFSNNLDFIIWGNDNGATTLTSDDKHPSFLYRLAREWQVAVNGSPGTVTVRVIFSGNNGSAASYALHVDSDGTFASGTTDYTGTSISGDTITFENVSFSDGDYFTLGQQTLTLTEGPRGPGGIEDTDGTSNLVLWLDANTIDQSDGSEVLGWADQSGYGNDANTVTGRAPEFRENQLNAQFPLVDFNIGDYDYMRITDDTSLNPDQISVFTVASYSSSTLGWGAILQKTTNQGGGTEEGGGWGIVRRNTNAEIRGFVNNRNANSPGGGVNGALSYDTPTIISMVYDQAENEMFFDESSQGTMAYTSPITDVATFLYLGYDEEQVRYLDGTIAETVIIDRPVNDAERIIISNYLSAKYGIGLAAASEAYLEDENGYDFDVAGIGQAADGSQHLDAQGTGILRIFNPTDLGTNEFLIWGHDNGGMEASETSDVPSGVDARLKRKWNVSERTAAGSVGPEVGDVDLVFNLDGLGGITPTDLRLIIDTDNDGVFTDETPISGASAVGETRYAFLGVDLDDSQAFTVGTANNSSTPLISATGPQGPGGVGRTDGTSDLTLWLDANEITGLTHGQNLTGWTDLSGYGNNATVGNAPSYNTSWGGNGFPAATFNAGSSEYLSVSANSRVKPTSELSVFIAGNFDSTSPTYGCLINSASNDLWNDGWGIGRQTASGLQYFTNWNGTSGQTRYILDTSIDNQTHIYGMVHSGSATTAYEDESSFTFSPSSISYTDAGDDLLIGAGPNNSGANYFMTGEIGEVILYNTNLNDAQRIIVNNYLSAKYGITLSANDVYTQDDSGYDYDVAGIGQASDGTNHTDAQGTGIVRMLNPSALDNGDFLMWGHDNGALAATETSDIPSTVDSRLARVWRASETADVGNVVMVWDLSSLGMTDPTRVRLLVDTNNNNDFTDDPAIGGASLLSGNSFVFPNISAIEDGYRFTLGLIQPAPGAITSDLEVWLKTDLGTQGVVTITGWEDQSTNTNDANASGDPQYVAAAINYNPAIDFDGTGDYLSTATTSIIGNNGNYTKYAVIVAHDLSTNRSIVATDASGNHDLRHTSTGLLRPQHDATQMNNISGLSENQVHIVGFRYSGTNNYTVIDGRSVLSSGSVPFDDGGSIEIGGKDSGSDLFDGYIAETVVYNANKTDSEADQIESYLAMKYGVTLNNSGGGTEGDYTATDGTVIWDSDLNANYHNDVIAIGRDDNSSFYQRQSQSQDDTLRVFIGNLASDNASNGGTIANDVSYLVIGHNGGVLKSNGTIDAEAPNGISSRLVREWKITNTNFTEEYTIHFEWEEVGSFDIADIRLLVDSDGDFSDATIYGPADGLTFTEGSIIVGGINTTHIPADGTSYVTLASASSGTPLPIELISFHAEIVDEGSAVKLDWSTASETNNDFFTIERSQNSEDWSDILLVPGAGNSSGRLDYTAYDEDPLYGLSYYRLKQTDFDGTFSHSNTVFVTLGEFDDELTIYPNPTQDRITIKGAPEQIRQIAVINALGQDVTNQVRMISNTAATVTLDVSELPVGVFNILTPDKSIRMIKTP